MEGQAVTQEDSVSGSKQEKLMQLQRQLQQRNKGKGPSIYDCLKIKVRLDEHYYIFSRFMILRVLTMCRISKLDASKIAKDTKKKLIEEGKFDIQQQELEGVIFHFMRERGFTDLHINRYRMNSKFFRTRTPLIIMICGTPRVCKSIIATYLAERLNISNMLQTSIVEMMMKLIDEDRFFKDCDLFAEEDEERIIEKYMNRSRAIKQGVGSDINKALTDGKPVIIEGYELVPELYVRLKSTEVDDSPGEAENGSISKAEDQSPQQQNKMNHLQQYIRNEVQLKTKSKHLARYNVSDHRRDVFEIIGQEKRQLIGDPLVVPILLILNERDMKFSIENVHEQRQIPQSEGKELAVAKRLRAYQVIQQHLLKQSHLTTVIPVNFHNIEHTLDTIHDIILEKIEAKYASEELN